MNEHVAIGEGGVDPRVSDRGWVEREVRNSWRQGSVHDFAEQADRFARVHPGLGRTWLRRLIDAGLEPRIQVAGGLKNPDLLVGQSWRGYSCLRHRINIESTLPIRVPLCWGKRHLESWKHSVRVVAMQGYDLPSDRFDGRARFGVNKALLSLDKDGSESPIRTATSLWIRLWQLLLGEVEP